MSVRSELSPETLAAYRATAQRRWQAKQAMLALRKARAMAVARQAARLLQAEFGATQVWLFGSLAHGAWFSPSSDIDLAAWGIPATAYFRAVAHLQDLSPEFRIDLVTMEQCKPALRELIWAEGQPL
jgi:uncharacterized protein